MLAAIVAPDAPDGCALCLGRLARLPRRDGRRRRAGGLRRPLLASRTGGAAGAWVTGAGGAVGTVAVAPFAVGAPCAGSSSTSSGAGADAWACEGGVGRLVVGEELLPCLTDGVRVLPELLVHLLDQPGVGPEVRVCRRRAHDRPGYRSQRRPGQAQDRRPPPVSAAVRRLTTVTAGGTVRNDHGGSGLNNPSTDKIRNVAVLGHSGSGKTTLAEALLVRAGVRAEGGAGRGRHDGVRHRGRGAQADDVAVARRGAVRVEGLRRRDLQGQPPRHARLRRLRR